MNPEEIKAIAAQIGKSVVEMRMEHTHLVERRVSLKERANGDCTFLDPQTRRCTVYAVRPRQCRTWPFWDSNLESPETWQEIQPGCPGAGHGQLFTLEEIEARATIIKL